MKKRVEVRFQRGFSIIDALIGMMLMAIVIVGFLLALRHATMGTTDNTAKTQATFVAQEILERIKNYDNSSNSVAAFTALLSMPSVVPASVTRDNVTYQVGAGIASAATITGTLANSLIPVQVNVSWTENGATKGIRMVNYYYTNATPVPTGPAATATPTPTATVALIPQGIAVHYEVTNQWGTGATINVTIKNNTYNDINGWNLAWTFSGNQTISGPWNGTCQQSGHSVTIKNVSYNPTISKNGGTLSFGFNLSYSGTNSAPTAFTLNGIACTTY